MKKILRRITKYVAITILSLIGLVAISLAVMQTRFFKNWLRDFVVEKSEANLNAEIAIERIDGNLISHAEVSGVLVTSADDTVFYLPKLSVSLSPFRFFRGEIQVDSILVDSPYLKMVQLSDGTWNLNRLTKSESAEPDEAQSSSEPFGFKIILGDFYLKNAEIVAIAANSNFPRRIKNFNIRLTAEYSEGYQKLHLKQFALQTEHPSFSLEQFSFLIARNKQQIAFEDFILETDQNELQGQGTYYEADSLTSEAAMRSRPINFGELRAFLPSLQIYGNPRFTVETDYQGDSLRVKLEVSEQDQQITFDGRVSNLSTALQDSTFGDVGYSMVTHFRNVDPSHWFADTTLGYAINGLVELRGKGLTPEEAELSFKGDFQNSVFMSQAVDSIGLSGEYNRGDLLAELRLGSHFGRLFLNAKAFDLIQSQKFEFLVDVRDLNMAAFAEDTTLNSDVNLSMFANGEGFEPETGTGNLRLNLYPSTISKIKLDTLFSSVRYEGVNYTIDTLHAESNFARLNLSGQGGLNRENNLNFTFRLGDLMSLHQFLQADTLHARGYLAGALTGTLDSLSAVANLKIADLLFNDFAVDSIDGDLSVFGQVDSLFGQGRIDIVNAGTPNFRFDSTRIETEFSPELAEVSVDISRLEDFKANLRARVVRDTIPRIVFPNLSFDIKNFRWRGGGENMQVVLEKNAYRIQNFELTSQSESSNRPQRIRLHGILNVEGEQNMQVRISGIDIAPLTQAFEMPMEAEGKFSFNMDITGAGEAPVIAGHTKIQNGRLNQFSYKTLGGHFDYENEQLSWRLSLVPLQQDSISINGTLPMNLTLANQGELIHYDRPIRVRIKTDGLPLSAIKGSQLFVESVEGRIVCDLSVGGTMRAPEASGFFRIRDGSFELPDYGVNYRDVLVDLSVDSTRLSLKKLQARRDDGELRASGFLKFDSTLTSGEIHASDFELVADEFYLTRHRDYEIQISADAQLSGAANSANFGGNLTILRSSLFLPAFMNEGRAAPTENKNLPMLVAATRNSEVKQDSLESDTNSFVDEEETELDFYENLSGTFKVSIPKNTWLKSPEMTMEIAGDLDLVKNGPDLEIFGGIQIVRGHYDVYGKRFTILEGELTFQGGSEYNPEIDLKAEHVFRTEAREKKVLKLLVSGTAYSPTFEFRLGGEEITEGDAVAYLMFGRRLNELTQGQRSQIASDSDEGSGAAGLAKGFAAGLVTDQLTKTLGNTLNLDVVEIKAQDGWQSATFVVGKYLTNDLFLSYERGFGKQKKGNIEPQTITLEYELTPFLFFQLINGGDDTSGYDVIFKIHN